MAADLVLFVGFLFCVGGLVLLVRQARKDNMKEKEND